MFSVFAMCGRVFLMFAALSWCSAGVEGKASVKIQTYAGQTVTLPCHISMSDDQEVPSIEWSKEAKPRIFAYVYRGCEMFQEKNPVFHYRTHLFMNELKNGNISLRLSNVSRSDSGIYVCKIIQKPPQDIATVELLVGAVSEPKLSVVPAIGGGVTLQCEANCWFPQPQITFLDAQRNFMRAEDTKTDGESGRGCFTATKRLTVQTAQRVTCQVHQPEINQTRVTEIYIPDDCLTSCTWDIVIAVVTAIPLSGCLVAITFLCKKYVSCVRERKELSLPSSLHISTCSSAEVHNWSNQAELNNQNTITELQRENAELASKLHNKDETIRRLTEERDELRSNQMAAMFQHDQPTIDSSLSKPSPDVSGSINPSPDVSKSNHPTPDPPPQDNTPKPAASTNNNHPKSDNLPQNKNSRPNVSKDNPAPGAQIQRICHNISCPSLLTHSNAEPSSPPSALPKVRKPVSHSRSMSESQCRPNSARSQRRYTVSVASFNRFAPLENLPEDDSEPLLNEKGAKM